MEDKEAEIKSLKQNSEGKSSTLYSAVIVLTVPYHIKHYVSCRQICGCKCLTIMTLWNFGPEAQVKELEERLTTSGAEVERLQKETRGSFSKICYVLLGLFILPESSISYVILVNHVFIS